MIVALDEKRSTTRALRNHAERNRFRPAQLRCGFVEINQTRRADAFDVAAVRREIQIRFEDFVFRIMPLQLERAQDLFELSRHRSGMKMKPEPRELHRDCRSTGGPVVKSDKVEKAP